MKKSNLYVAKFIDHNRPDVVLGSSIRGFRVKGDYLEVQLGTSSNGGNGSREFYKYDLKCICREDGSSWLWDSRHELRDIKEVLCWVELYIEQGNTNINVIKNKIEECNTIIKEYYEEQ